MPPNQNGANTIGALTAADYLVDVKIDKNHPDPVGDLVEFIFCKTERYILYQSAGQIRYVLPKSVDIASRYRASINTLAGLKASIDASRTWFQPRYADDPSFELDHEYIRSARETCWALQQAFEAVDIVNTPPTPVAQAVIDSSKTILSQVDDRLRSLLKSRVRKRYVVGNGVSFFLFAVVLCLGCWNLPALWPDHKTVYDFCRFGAFGALGAFLSVLSGIKAIDPDLNVGGWEALFGGVTRILIGVIGAFIVVLALGFGLIDSTFANSVAHNSSPNSTSLIPPNPDNLMRMKYLLAFVGGFSESLLPNILKKTETVALPSDRPVTAPATTTPA